MCDLRGHLIQGCELTDELRPGCQKNRTVDSTELTFYRKQTKKNSLSLHLSEGHKRTENDLLSLGRTVFLTINITFFLSTS